jgi:hypothetical protein
MSEQANPRCQITTVDPVGRPPTSCVWCELPAGHLGMHYASRSDGGALKWPASNSPGVWLVTYNSEGGDHVIPFPTEVEALRFVNGETHHRAWFVPFGVNLHDVIFGRTEVIAHDLKVARDGR